MKMKRRMTKHLHSLNDSCQQLTEKVKNASDDTTILYTPSTLPQLFNKTKSIQTLLEYEDEDSDSLSDDKEHVTQLDAETAAHFKNNKKRRVTARTKSLTATDKQKLVATKGKGKGITPTS